MEKHIMKVNYPAGAGRKTVVVLYENVLYKFQKPALKLHIIFPIEKVD